MTSLQQEVFNCVFSNDLETIKELLEREETMKDILGAKDEFGRNALMVAGMMGRSAIVRELLSNGALINEQTVEGYSSLHFAACWGHLETVRALLELGADTHAKTFRGEKPVDVARRNSKTDCADYIILTESVKDLTTDPEKNLTKEEKKICRAACSAKSDWIQSVMNPTVTDFLAQRKDMEETLQPILNKLSAETVETPGKTLKKSLK
ncbi:ankyrin repeat domain-containing protein 45 isoform X2 [Halichoeres trimaculatus]|uniref:ankyrin repeat domain-containing protein 45 isoform X2 n=1 Tax=Halichoeres trimaculatus TaxID=147232 RepID=UPI003D9DFCF0